jgi:unsaturated rhamnogalacturonyl hydrolase
MKIRCILCSVLALFFLQTSYAQPEFTADSVKKVCKRVGDARMNTHMGNFWQHGAFFSGAMALYNLTKEQKYLDSVIAWGNYYQWRRCNWVAGNPGTDLDNICCEQAYLEAYLTDTVGHWARAQESVSDMSYYCYTLPPNGKTRPRYAYSDIMFMAGPTYARAAVAGRDPAIFDSLYVIWSNTSHDLYDPRVKLFWRGASSIDTTKPIPYYWSRGNGWVIGSACRILDFLPANHPRRAFFETIVADHCAGLKPWQDATDGCWRSSITDPQSVPNKETSGTAFFCFGMLWAINHGLIDSATYWPVARKAWDGLLGCIQPNGRVGFSQPPGTSPSPATATDNAEYTDGAFLMAGYELYKLITIGPVSTISTPSRFLANQINPRIQKFSALGVNHRISLPAHAAGAEVYSAAGRKVWECCAGTSGSRTIIIPRSLDNSGTLFVKFTY